MENTKQFLVNADGEGWTLAVDSTHEYGNWESSWEDGEGWTLAVDSTHEYGNWESSWDADGIAEVVPYREILRVVEIGGISSSCDEFVYRKRG